MTIKEVEQALELQRATIRFYEREKLITPQRSGNAYREYSEEDIATLKKIIILRKIGLSVSEIKDFLDENVPLQELLEKNILELQERMNELEGAIKVCKKMQDRQEDFDTFDEVYYWEEIRKQENAGNKFLDVLNDAFLFEKKVVFEEFDLGDPEGKLRYGKKTAVLKCLGTCLLVGFLWFFLDGMNVEGFVDGFFWPFICIIITSIFGLPLYFLNKKHPKAAATIKKIGDIAVVIFAIAIFLFAIFAEEI